MEQYMENYEDYIDKIIKIHKNSLQEILTAIKNLYFFDNDFLLRIISYLKMCKLYEITCETFPDFKYYMLNLGESNFLFYDNIHCSCNLELSKKIISKNICIHLLVYKILLGINSYIKIQIEKEEMIKLIKEQNNM